MKRASCGLDFNFPIEICSVIKSASEYGFDFICVPLAHPRFKREFTFQCKDRRGPFTRPDVVLKSNEWNSLIAGKISPYLDVDSNCFKTQAKLALDQELNYGSHLDVPAVIIYLRGLKCFNLAQIINSNLAGMKPYQIWVQVPMISQMKEASIWRSDLTEDVEDSTWEWWNRFYILCNSDRRLGIVLEMTSTLPPQEELDRWMGEPIKCLIIPTRIFLTNKKGYPVLPKSHQNFIKSLVPLEVQIIINGNNHHYSLDCYQKYIDYLWQEATVQQNSKLDAQLLETSAFPLQFPNDMPKKSEIIERDLVKYKMYSRAIQQALLDYTTEEILHSTVINIMIIGRGRVPMISATLQAALSSNKKIKIYAIEKNPHIIVTLQAYQEELWHNSVEIIFNDSSLLSFYKKIDILLCDLLSSFGDNELCPEVIDQAQNFLKEGGICIPESYMSYLCPVQSSKMYSDLKINKDKSDYEVPYIVSQKNKCNISPPTPLFRFHHPNYSIPINNSRHKTITFEVSQNTVLHGFTGYFETILYKNINLSIVPETHTPGLFSWPPIFFPISEPVQVKAGDQIEVSFWRLVNNKRVWYEWTITKPVPLPIHNTNGRSSNLSLEYI